MEVDDQDDEEETKEDLDDDKDQIMKEQDEAVLEVKMESAAKYEIG